MPRIYISPSSQERNHGIAPFTVEETEMNKIADILIPLLDKDGRFVTKRNSPSWDVSQMASDSNSFKADIHLAIHSNAGGGVGTEVYAYGPGTNSERFAKALYNQVAPLSPGKDRGVKFNKGLYEVGDHVKATAALIELGFHDNAADAQWLATNSQQIAEALYKGICDYFGIAYCGPQVVEIKGVVDVLDVAVLLFTKEDYWAGVDVVAKNGNCAMFIRPVDHSVPKDAMSVKHLIVVGGAAARHPNETLLSGNSKYDTAQAVAKYLG